MSLGLMESPLPSLSTQYQPPIAQDEPWPRSLRYSVLALVLVGVAWRTLRYLLQFPIWGDEAYLCLNFLDRDLLGLTQPLRFVQVAPILFLWSEWIACHLLGPGELALRLLPFLAGVGALLLFWRLARLALDPMASALAVGLLAVSYYPVRHCCEIKPYSFDLLMAVALLIAAVSWLQRPQRRSPLVLLVLLTPLAMAVSYPAIFVAAGVSLVLLPAMWRLQCWGPRLLYVALNGAIVVSFVVLYGLIGTQQYGSAGGATNWYWQGSFPPAEPLGLLRWLALIHTGNLAAYPIGGPNGLSVVTFLLCAAGAWQLIRARRWDLLALCLLPFGLTLCAAALHRYPYGGSARIAQHLAPAICLLAGLGAAGLIRALCSIVAQPRGAMTAVAMLLVIAVVGIGRDLFRPYKTEGDRQIRRIIADVLRQAGPDDQIVVIREEHRGMGAAFEWYLRQGSAQFAWDARVDWSSLDSGDGQLWCFCLSPETANQLRQESTSGGQRRILVDHAQYTVQLGKTEETLEYYELFRWKRAPVGEQ